MAACRAVPRLSKDALLVRAGRPDARPLGGPGGRPGRAGAEAPGGAGQRPCARRCCMRRWVPLCACKGPAPRQSPPPGAVSCVGRRTVVGSERARHLCHPPPPGRVTADSRDMQHLDRGPSA